jgi:cell division protein FtsI (penicillin-binding protein 3)
MVDEPRGAIFGGVVAAPAFREIASFALQYYEIAPDAPVRKPETDGALRTAAAAPTSRD